MRNTLTSTSLVILFALATTSSYAGDREHGDGDREHSKDCVAIYSPPIENLGAIGCTYINTTNRTIMIRINNVDQFGNLIGSNTDLSEPGNIGGGVSRRTVGNLYACLWTYRGKSTDLRATITNYKFLGEDPAEEPVPVYSMTVPNLGVRAPCP